MKDRIAKFNDLSAGSTPLLPSGPFGLGAPPAHAQSQARGGLIGNRIPSMDPKTAGILPGAPGNLRKASETGGTRAVSANPSRSEGRSESPAQSVASSTTSADQGAPETLSPATSRSASPSRAPAQTNIPVNLVVSSLPDQGDGTMTPSSTLAEASESSTSLLLSTQESTPNSLSRKNLNLNSESTPVMARQDSNTSAQASVAAPSVSSMQAQYEPSSTGSAEVTKMIDVSGVSTPMGTPRAAQRDLASEQDSQQGEGSVAGDTDISGTANEGNQLPTATDLGNIHLRQSNAELDPAADIEDVVGARDQGADAMPAQDVVINSGESQSVAVDEEDGENAIGAEKEVLAASPHSATSTNDADETLLDTKGGALAAVPIVASEPLVSEDEQEDNGSQFAAPAVPALVETGANADETATGPNTTDEEPIQDRNIAAVRSEPLQQQTDSNAAEVGIAYDHQDVAQGDSIAVEAVRTPSEVLDRASLEENQIAEAIPAKPRARLGPTEVVYLPNSDSEEDDDDVEGRSDDEGADQQNGDFLSEHPDNTEVRNLL